jgi:rod shape determining protein RodA
MKKVFKADPIIFICTFLLISIGLFTLYSLTLTGIESRAEFFQKEFQNQLIYAFVGIVVGVLIFVSPFYYLRLKWILFLIYLFTSGLLIYTAFFGLNVKGVRRWISFGSSVLDDGTVVGGFTIQGSEFAKITVILITSFLLSVPKKIEVQKTLLLNKIKDFLGSNKYFFLAIGSILGIMSIIIAQNSLSVAGIIGIIAFIVVFAGVEKKSMAIAVTVCFLISILISQTVFFNLSIQIRLILFIVPLLVYIFSVYSGKLNDMAIFFTIAIGLVFGSLIVNITWNNVLKDYQKERVETFLNPDANKEDEGFQQEQSKISIGAGQLFGQGFRQVSDSRLLLLPEPTTDFIFAIFSFKFGFIGDAILIIILLILVSRIFQQADRMSDKYSSLILIGCGGMILVQFFMNIGMNIGILPVGGSTLPFVSAGGSSLISMIIAIAICENVIATNEMEKTIHERKDKVVIEGWNS